MEGDLSSSQSKMYEIPLDIRLQSLTTPQTMTIADQSQMPSYTLSTKQSGFPAGTSKKKILGARAFAKLALFNDPYGAGDLKPIRRPLPAHVPLLSDSEDSLSDSELDTPPSSFIKKKTESDDPFYNPDESDSDMSPGVSLPPSPKLLPISGSLSQVMTNTQRSGPTYSMSRSNSNTQHAESSLMAPPLRRGLITPTTDFDVLLNFKNEIPAPLPNDGKKKRKRRSAGLEEKAIKEERREVSMACHDQVQTPEMSWVIRHRKLIDEKVGKADKAGRGGEGSSIDVGGGSGGGAGKGKRANKRTARRVGSVPKRQYVWKDTKVKNKAHFQKARGGAKGKGKEVAKE